MARRPRQHALVAAVSCLATIALALLQAAVVAAAATDGECESSPDDIDVDVATTATESSEYQRLYRDAESVKNEDLTLLTIRDSPVDGRGVFLTRPVPAMKEEEDGTTPSVIGTLFYEVDAENSAEFDVHPNPPIASHTKKGYYYARGYIVAGGTLGFKYMSVQDALVECDNMAGCEGITFQDEKKEFANPRTSPSHEVRVEFKDQFQMGASGDWQSYLKRLPDRTANFYPLACNSFFLPNPPPRRLDPELILPCWPRFVNHACPPRANVKIVSVPVPEDFVLPGAPWQRVRKAIQLHPVRDLEAGEEIIFNYEDQEYYMMRKVDGVDECNKNVVG